MTRDQARDYIKESWRRLYPAAADGKGIICPICGHGTHGDGIVKNRASDDPHGLKCFTCGFSGDVLSLIEESMRLDYNGALQYAADQLNISIDSTPYNPPRSAQEPRKVQEVQEHTEAQEKQEEPAQADYTGYYRACRERLADPRAAAYLKQRGISMETAAAYGLGFDPEADPANAPGAGDHDHKPHPAPRIIIPTNASHYVGRAIDPDNKYKKMNPKDSKPGIFNEKALYSTAPAVFICEGVFDALSIIEAGAPAIALCSTANTGSFLTKMEHRPTTATLILSFDQDDAGRRYTQPLREGLDRLNISHITGDVCGEYGDPNEALTGDRTAFIAAVKTTEQTARFPGLLTTARAIEMLEAVDDHYLEMRLFPQLSATIKIKTHDTVVIAADTGAGKSSLALNFLHELQDRYPAMYINLEMDEATVIQRLVSIHTGIELDEIEGYKHDQTTRSKVNGAIQEITARREIQLLEDVYDLKQIEAQIQATTRGRTEPTIVFIDTGLLVTLPNKSVSRYERFTQISEELRRMSRLNNVVMFVLLQQNREGKKEEQKAPTNSSLKESGSWENDATKIMFLWENPRTRSKELVITKNRSGKTGSIELDYSPHTQRYSEAKGGFTPHDGATPKRR